jgi:peptide/nickel transport system substrate-binding protein
MRKDLTIALMLVLTLSLLVQVTSVGAVIPNADHIYAVTIGTPETVDPAWAYDTASGEIIQNIYEPLCMFNNTETGQFLPAVADWWPGIGTGGNNMEPIDNPNGTQTWLFRIRGYGDSPNPKMAWQNASYGFVTPADVEYSIERGMYMDHTNGPQWMFYEPLLGGASSYDYDLDGGGDLNATEWAVLDVAVANAIQQNGTHVWFNLVTGYAPFQQILSQTWSVIMCKQWCIDQGLWNGVHTYAEFKRTWDPDPPGPLMNTAKAMGSGPYKLEFMNEDPDTGYYTLLKFDGYWQGWGPKFVTEITTKSVSEWANRKAQFFSTDAALQADFAVIPRANVPELHQGGNKDAATLPGIRLYMPPMPTQTLDAFYYTYEIAADSPYVPVVGTTPNRFLLKDRNMRLVMNYLVNFTQYISDVFLGEATQSPMCMPNGTLYWNGSKPMYDINLAKAQAYLDVATGYTGAPGSVKAAGITMKLVYNTGNTARETFCKIVADGLTNKLTWGPSAVVDIQALGIPWATYLPQLRAKQLPVFSIGWMADFPDPHNWFYPFMSSTGTYSSRQVVTYGLDPSTMNWEDTSYGPPPYTNAFGETVTGINGTYIDHLISTGVHTSNLDPRREMLYNELFDIYHAEASQLPTVAALARHYERTWIHGWIGTFNENPIAPGRYYYTMYKEALTTPIDVDVAAFDVALGSNNITAHLISQSYHSPRAGVPWMKLNYSDGATVPIVNCYAYVKSYNGSSPTVVVLLTWVGVTASGHAEEFGYTYDLITGGGQLALGPEAVSNIAPLVGDYYLWINTYVMSDNAINTNVTKNFNAQWFNATGFCDINADLVVDGQDFQLVKKAVPSSPGATKWRWAADTNSDGIVDGQDFQQVKSLIPTLYAKA